MSLQAKTFLNLLAGGLAGTLAWALTDLTGWFASIFETHYLVRSGLFGAPKFLLYGAIFGLLLGLLLGIVDALSLDSRSRMQRLLIISAIVGFAGGWIGLSFGEAAFSGVCALFRVDPEAQNPNPAQFLLVTIGRALGYAFIGGFVGVTQGLAKRSKTIARQGAFGGLVGGALGGIAFQVIIPLFNSAIIARLFALVATGALVGFFVGLVQNLFKQAWIRVVLGTNEGKEYLIAKPVTTIGRSELSDIGLFGDPAIAPTHIAIESLASQNRHRLRFVGGGGARGSSFVPPLVNGQSVGGEQWLADGDTIQLGKRTLLFHEKATRRGAAPISDAPAIILKESPAYVGQELAHAPTAASRAPLTTPADIVAQMGAAPTTEATVMSVGAASAGLGTRLICIQGPYAGQSFSLSHAPTTIGRAADRDIALSADTSISRAQARITYSDSRHLIADDGSSNGTFVNGARVAGARPLTPGDTIQLGDTALRYE